MQKSPFLFILSSYVFSIFYIGFLTFPLLRIDFSKREVHHRCLTPVVHFFI